MKKAIPTFVLCAIFCASLAHAQGVAYSGSPVINGEGQPLAGVSVAISTVNPCGTSPTYTYCGGLPQGNYTGATPPGSAATLYTDATAGTTRANPLTTDPFGNWTAYLATGGTYWATVYSPYVVAQVSVFSVGSNSGLFCALAGGSGCVMTGPIEGNASFTDPDFGAATGGSSIVDANGNVINSGKAAGYNFETFATGTGAAKVYMTDYGGGTVLFDVGGQNVFTASYGNGTNGVMAFTVPGSSKQLEFNGIPTYANNAAALAAGLVAGDAYTTAQNPDYLAIVQTTDPSPSQYQKLRCETGLGDGLNAIPSGTYPQFFCANDSGVNWSITAIHCYTDNNGSSTLAASNNAATALLTGPITCTDVKSTWGAAGTLSSAITLVPGDAVNFSFIADGTSTQTTWVVSITQ